MWSKLAAILVAISGSEVPKAISVEPITNSEILKRKAIRSLWFIIKSAPKISDAIDKTKMTKSINPPPYVQLNF